MKSLSFLLVIGLFAFMNPTKLAYQIFDAKGKTTDYEALRKEALKADIVLFGELHNNPICHWLQIELAKDLAKEKGKNMVMGAEMFEADNQLVLTEYTQKTITDKQLKEEAKMWNNFATDYKPLVELARNQGIPMIATNIPRRYASIVSKQGIEALTNLSPEAKAYIAPLPIKVDLQLPAYAKMMEMMSGNAPHGSPQMKPEFFAQAQASKDATMAHFILKNWQEGKTFLHFNGSFHSDNFESIVWYLKQANPKLKIMTISSVEQAEVEKLATEHQNKANFIIAIPESMTKTY
jgi:uncharacterized iron-regulated protein